jgi:hypothetical protein
MTAELAALRQGVEEIRIAHQPKLEAVEAMDDLAREVKELRQKLANPPPAPLPPLLLPVGPGGPRLTTEEMTGGVGGTQAGLNDLYWVLSKVRVNNEDRAVLCLYRARPDKGFNLEDVRMLNLDLQIIELKTQYHSPTVADLLKILEKK